MPDEIRIKNYKLFHEYLSYFYQLTQNMPYKIYHLNFPLKTLLFTYLYTMKTSYIIDTLRQYHVRK